MDAIRSGEYRHRATIQRQVNAIDPATGYRTRTWELYLPNEPAEWLAGPGREYLAAESVRAKVEGRIKLRYHAMTAGITHDDRLLIDGEVWSIKAPPMLDRTMRRTVTLMVAREPNDGA